VEAWDVKRGRRPGAAEDEGVTTKRVRSIRKRVDNLREKKELKEYYKDIQTKRVAGVQNDIV